MGLFSKNPNEASYIGNKKHWVDVIKNSGAGDLLIWRQPEEDFNTGSTLIVMPGEEAIFIKGGKIENVFTNGTYKLSTENYPFISRLRNAFSGGISTFNCVVYFVRSSHSVELLWGTDSPIQVRDPLMHIATSIQARGAYKIKIENPSLFLTKLHGNNKSFTTQEDLIIYFANEFQQHIKSILAKYILELNKEILGICAEQTKLANEIQPIFHDILSGYGIELVTFSISAIDIPNNDPNRKKLEEAFASKGMMNILGEDWAKIQAAEILNTLAKNPGAGGMAATAAGIGMGVTAGSAFTEMAQQMFVPIQNTKSAEVQATHNAKNRNNLLTDKNQSVDDDPVNLLKKLKVMLDSGLITQEIYDSKMTEIINRM